MGWLKHILLGDMGQSIDIMETKDAVAGQASLQLKQSRRIAGVDGEIARLKRRTEQLHLAVTAMSRFLVEKGVVDAGELEGFIATIDGEDGEVDGKLDFKDEVPRPRLVTGEVPKTPRLDR